MDDETFAEYVYEALTCGKYDDVSVQLLRLSLSYPISCKRPRNRTGSVR